MVMDNYPWDAPGLISQAPLPKVLLFHIIFALLGFFLIKCFCAKSFFLHLKARSGKVGEVKENCHELKSYQTTVCPTCNLAWRLKQATGAPAARCAISEDFGSLSGVVENINLQKGWSMQARCTSLLIRRRPQKTGTVGSFDRKNSFNAKHVGNQNHGFSHKEHFKTENFLPEGPSNRTIFEVNKEGLAGSRKQAIFLHKPNEHTGMGYANEEAEQNDDGSYRMYEWGCGAEDVIMSLRKSLKLERKALRFAYTELEEERRAAETAAKEAMAMILRLQEEKARLQLESAHFLRMAEERAIHDEQAMQLLQEELSRKDRENLVMVKQLSLFRSVLFRDRRQATSGIGTPLLSNASMSSLKGKDVEARIGGLVPHSFEPNFDISSQEKGIPSSTLAMSHMVDAPGGLAMDSIKQLKDNVQAGEKSAIYKGDTMFEQLCVLEEQVKHLEI